MGINQFTEMTFDQIKEYFHIMDTSDNTCPQNSANDQAFKSPYENDSPESWDWRDVGVETEVRDQGSCNSDWAMAAVGALEAANIIKFNSTASYSPQ